MKILIVSIFRLESFPPILSLIYDLTDLEYDVSIITTGITKENKDLLENKNINVFTINTKMHSTAQAIKPSFSKQNIFSKIYFSKRLSKVKACFLKLVKKFLYVQLTKNFMKKIKKISFDYIWFSDIDTANLFKNKLNNMKYIISVQELIVDRKYKTILEEANQLFVPEETRSFIIRSSYNLKNSPVVLPNKPYDFRIIAQDKNILPKEINDRKIILYQGLFSKERNLMPFVNAIKELENKFVFLLQINTLSSNKEQYDYISNVKNVFVVPTLPAPQHLSITQSAYIGIVTYYHKDLNNEFCAPNKIFEYSKFGLPMISNDVAGLLNTVGKYNAGICLNLDMASTQDIKNAILKIDENYEYYSDNSKKLYESVDRKKILKKVLKNL